MSIEVKNLIEQLPTFVVALDLRPIVACSDESYAETRQQWVNKVYSLQTQLQKEVERLTGDSIEVLDEKREALAIKLKSARVAFDEMNSQSAFFQSSERNLSKEVTTASFNVNLKRNSPLQPAYATKSDHAQWQRELDELQAIENDAMRRYNNNKNLQYQWQADCQRLKQAHDNLAVEESQLRNQLNRLRGIITSPQPTPIGLRA
ncbi:MAG: hypothetical protein WCE63_07455 [Acidobacteriaceae bacterium]